VAVSHENLSNGAGLPPKGTVASNLRDLGREAGPLDVTLPPTPIRDLLAASGATLFVLATDPALVAVIRRAAEQHPLFVVETWPELLEAVESSRCGIALLDAAVLGSRVPESVAALAAYADRLVTLVAADRAAAQEYVQYLSDGRVHRLLIKPAAIGSARLLIESATARRLQLREQPANDDPHQAKAASRIPKWAWATLVAAVVVAAVGTSFIGSRLGWWGSASVDVAAAPAAPVPQPMPTTAERVADYHARAAAALQDGRLVEPAGDNALDHYLAIIAFEPADPAAGLGISSVVDSLFTRAEEALLAGSLEDAATALDQVRRVDAASSRLAFLEAQLGRALAELALPAESSSATSAATPTELDSVLSLAAARLRRGQLLAPAGDSARAYLDRAVQLAPADPRVAELRTDLAAALIAAGRLVADADAAAAADLAAEAQRLGAPAAALAALEREIGAARERSTQRALAERLDTALARVQAGALFAPPGDSALAHLTRLQTETPALAGLAEAWEALRDAGLAALDGAIERGDWAAADSLLAGLVQVPDGEAAAAAAAAELAAGRLQANYLATAAPAGELRLQSSVPPAYPPDALARGIEGWVELEYVVDRTGVPRDVAVVQSLPVGRFDAAALTAVRQYRYVPFERDGRVYERRLRLRVRFEVQ
jgi:TonB family protein